jgi:uroporphyrinogen-III synthase
VLCEGATDAVVFLTGVGVHTIAQGASRLGRDADFLNALHRNRIAVRGPKTLNAVRRLGLVADVVAPEPFTSDSLLEVILRAWDVRGWRILVQRYGAPVPAFTGRLRAHGATVLEVSPYRWERPLDEDAVVRMIEDLADGWIDVLAATSAAQVDYLFEIARARGCAALLQQGLATPRLRVAAQGVVCAAAFKRQGVRVDLVPPRASMGALVAELARAMHQPATIAAASLVDDGADADEVVALLCTRSANAQEIGRVVGGLGVTSTVALLSGKSRRAERLAEDIAVQRGLAVHAVLPARAGRHPADPLVRRADRVLIVTGHAADADVAPLLRLAQRYAKPAQVIGPGRQP